MHYNEKLQYMQEYRMQIIRHNTHNNVKLQNARVQYANQIAQNGDLNAKNWQ